MSFDIIDETIENMVIAIGGIAETVKRLSVVEESSITKLLIFPSQNAKNG